MSKPDQHAYFMRLYAPHHQQLLRYCESILRNPTEAEDVVGETALIALERLHTLRTEDAFAYFLFGIARNLIRRLQRRQKFWGLFSIEQAQQLPAPTAPTLNEDVQALYQALDQLPKAQKEALILFELSGYSIKEIAVIQNSGISAVKQRLARGRRRLGTLLTPKKTALAYE